MPSIFVNSHNIRSRFGLGLGQTFPVFPPKCPITFTKVVSCLRWSCYILHLSLLRAWIRWEGWASDPPAALSNQIPSAVSLPLNIHTFSSRRRPWTPIIPYIWRKRERENFPPLGFEGLSLGSGIPGLTHLTASTFKGSQPPPKTNNYHPYLNL